MYKQLKKQIADKKVIHATRIGIENRIKFKIDNQLGLKGMSFQEVKIEMKTKKEDRFAKVFADIEDLDKQREQLLQEEEIIEEMLNRVDENISKLNDIELKVFRGMYIRGNTQQEIANAEGYTLPRIKQISSEINKKLSEK